MYNTDKVPINIYSLMNILYSMDDNNNKKEKWILKEFECIAESSKFENLDKIRCLIDYFEIDIPYNYVYLYFVSYDHLEKCTKQSEYSEHSISILSNCINSLNVPAEELEKSKANDFLKFKNALKVLKNEPEKFTYYFIRALEFLRNYLLVHYREENDDFFINEKEKWKTIGWLKLHTFHSLYQISQENINNNEGQIISISDLKNFNVPDNYDPADRTAIITLFDKWKTILKNDANKVFSNLVTFTDMSNHDGDREKALKDFEENQCNTILKSEPVEKNDGKSSFILRRLFKAYISNSHQLPDQGLRYILITLVFLKRDGKLAELLNSEKMACKEILEKLKKTMVNSATTNDELKKISEIGLLDFETEDHKFKVLEKGKSNEIKAALEKRKKLAVYFKGLVENQADIIQQLNSESEDHKIFIKEQLRNLRAILDNSILNKTLYWESILARGICDYIANLTDQEAVNEYEKLYAGIMGLV